MYIVEHEMALANTMFKQHPRRLCTWTSPNDNTRNQIHYISIAQRWKTNLMNCRTYPGADCDTDHQLLVATVKVRLAKRQRQYSIPPLNLEELKEEKAVHLLPQLDIIGAVVIIWRVRGKTIRSVLCNIMCINCAQCDAHTYEQT